MRLQGVDEFLDMNFSILALNLKMSTFDQFQAYCHAGILGLPQVSPKVPFEPAHL